MPKLKGLDFLRTLQNPPLVIITSAYEEYALEGYELNVSDYLLKPFRFDRFLKATNKALELFKLKQANNTISAESPELDANRLFIKSDKRHIQLDFSDIYYLESYGNYVKIWMENEYHLTPRTLSSFVEQLPEKDFTRIHKSFIINRNQLHFVEGNMVKMKNNKTVLIGKSYRTLVKKLIT